MNKIEKIQECFSKYLETDLEVIKIEAITGDASLRYYYRCYTSSGSYIACYDESDSLKNFLDSQKILEIYKIKVPKVFFSSKENHCTIQEDLGQETFLQFVSTKKNPDRYEAYKQVVENIFNFFKVQECEAQSECFMFNNKFDHEKLMSEVEHSEKFFLQSYLNVSDSKKLKEIRESFSLICTEISNCPQFIVHRDLHSRNIMVNDNQFVLIDFQDARFGNYTYDLVSLLEDAYFQVGFKNKQKLKELFYNKLKEYPSTKEITFEQFIYDYDLMAIQRIYKAIGSFASFKDLKNDDRYLKYIGLCFENLREKLEKYPQFENLNYSLSNIYYEF